LGNYTSDPLISQKPLSQQDLSEVIPPTHHCPWKQSSAQWAKSNEKSWCLKRIQQMQVIKNKVYEKKWIKASLKLSHVGLEKV